MKRTFIAFDIIPAPGTKAAFENIRQKLTREKISWVSDSRFHLTIKFLGDTDEADISGIIDSLKQVLTNYHSFDVALAGFGIFSSLRDPKVIWLGCRFDSQLEDMKKAIEYALVPFGFQPEARRFSPHFTLGRIKFIGHVTPLAELVKQYENVLFQKEQVNKIIFYESHLKATGAVYTPLEVFELSL